MLSVWRDFNDAFRALDFLNRHSGPLFYEWTPGGRDSAVSNEAWPSINVSETKDAFVYRAEVPGLGEGDVSIQVEDGALLLRGERKSETPKGYQAHIRERATLSFSHRVPLSNRVDANEVTATIKDGILTVTLPKAKDSLPRQIAVKAG